MAALASAELIGVGPVPASADVAAASATAFNYYTNVSLFGGPTMLRGYGQQTCTAPNTPSGCVPASGAAASASPSATCPVGGGTASVTDSDGAKAQYGPAVIFGGKWPPNLGTAPPSGPLTSGIDCVLGPSGHATASTDATLMPAGSAYPGGVGPGPFVADEVHSTCTAADSGTTASTTIVNGILETSYYTGDDPTTLLVVEESGDPKTTEPVPVNPAPNYTRSGTIDHVGDSYTIVFNEQIVNPDGSTTVNAAHEYLLGPTAVGDMVIGSSTCGATIVAPPVSQPVADFNGDGTTDISVYRPSDGVWYVKDQSATAWGGAGGDIPVPGDYNGGGTTDIAVYRPSDGVWYVKDQSATAWGGAGGDIPVPGDYNGGGTTDIAIYRPSDGTWYVKDQPAVQWGGQAGDIPVPGDYDGNGTTDIAIYRPSTGTWFVKDQPVTAWGGTAGDIPVPGDYNGGGTTDIAIYRPSDGTWYVKDQPAVQWGGTAGDIPVPGDYNGGGTTDIAIYRPSDGSWFVKDQQTTAWGVNGDRPLPLPSAIRMPFFP